MKLENIIKESDEDIEPASMEKILMYLEELWAEDEQFMELLKERVSDMDITWNQPWYQQTQCLTRAMKDNGTEERSYRTDLLCEEESKTIRKNWKKFIKKYGLPDKLISFARWKNKGSCRNPKRSPIEKARHYAISYLARGLERDLHQVYRHILTVYGAANRGNYSATEIKVIEICYHHCPDKAVPYLATALGREPRNVYNRIKEIFNGKPEKKKVKWTLPLASKFLSLLLKYTELSVEELKYRKIDKDVWIKIQEDMNHHYLHLQGFWHSKLHTQLYVKYNVKLRRLRRKVFKLLREFPYQVWTDIRWKDVIKLLPDGFTQRFIYLVCYNSIKRCKNYQKIPLEQIIENTLNKNKKQYINKCLKTLVYNDGNLTPIKYEDKLK